MSYPQPMTRRTTRNAADFVNRIEARVRDADESYFELICTHNADSDLRWLIDRVRKLEAALEPFAALVELVPERWHDDASYETGLHNDPRPFVKFSAGDVRRAAAALRGDNHE